MGSELLSDSSGKEICGYAKAPLLLSPILWDSGVRSYLYASRRHQMPPAFTSARVASATQWRGPGPALPAAGEAGGSRPPLGGCASGQGLAAAVLLRDQGPRRVSFIPCHAYYCLPQIGLNFHWVNSELIRIEKSEIHNILGERCYVLVSIRTLHMNMVGAGA